MYGADKSVAVNCADQVHGMSVFQTISLDMRSNSKAEQRQ